MTYPLLTLDALSLGFRAQDGAERSVLRNLSLTVNQGETLGLVGESGSGKSTVALAAMGYLKPGLEVFSGQVRFDGRDVFSLAPKALLRLRGGEVALIPQNAGQALTPTMTIGAQIAEALRLHSRLIGAARSLRVLEHLRQVRLPDPEALQHRYPHALSGGQQQRVAIAMALATGARLLLLDEPTTGLDLTTQAHILALLRDLRAETGLSMLCVSHDLGVIAQLADRIAIMYAGEVIETGAARAVLQAPEHPYTRALLAAVPSLDHFGLPEPLEGRPPPIGSPRRGCAFAPRCPMVEARCRDQLPPLRQSATGQTLCWRDDGARGMSRLRPYSTPRERSDSTQSILGLEGVSVSYARAGLFARLVQRQERPIVSDIGFQVRSGETLGLVGESGSGKSTILRAIAGLAPDHSGKIRLNGTNLPFAVARRDLPTLRNIQLIFQNPDSALNPRRTIAEILEAPLRRYTNLQGPDLNHRCRELLEAVRLPESYLDRLPAQLSGGEKQRVGIARAFAVTPDLVLCDEITSALDVSVQAAVLRLLKELQGQSGAAYVFVSHDLAVVRAIADRVVVLYKGRICEMGQVETVFARPFHPYTTALLGAVVEPLATQPPALKALDVSDFVLPKTGCPFQRHCPRHVGPICNEKAPPVQQLAPDHVAACHLPMRGN